MEYKDIIDFLFNKKEDEELFCLEDEELKSLDHKVDIADKELYKFIDSKVHPKLRKKLKHLLLEYSNAMCVYLRQENALFYKNGVSDGIKLIMVGLSLK